MGGLGGMGGGLGGPSGVSSPQLGGGGGGGGGGSMGGLPGMPASVPGLIPTTGASLLGGGNQLGARARLGPTHSGCGQRRHAEWSGPSARLTAGPVVRCRRIPRISLYLDAHLPGRQQRAHCVPDRAAPAPAAHAADCLLRRRGWCAGKVLRWAVGATLHRGNATQNLRDARAQRRRWLPGARVLTSMHCRRCGLMGWGRVRGQPPARRAGEGPGPIDPDMLRASHAAAQQQQQRKEYVAKQQRWLLFLRHCAKCQAPEGRCQYGQSCTVAKQLWRHILNCADPACEYPRCAPLPGVRALLRALACSVCVPAERPQPWARARTSSRPPRSSLRSGQGRAPRGSAWHALSVNRMQAAAVPCPSA